MATMVVQQPQIQPMPMTPQIVQQPPQIVQQPPQIVGQAPGGPTFLMASLYVGDLHPDVTEAMLFEKFAAAGPVLSIRVCRDPNNRRSLGYAYVNFQHHHDAARAIDMMNFDMMLNKPIRIMWSMRDPSIRRSGTGNIFIKNLGTHIETKAIYDTFSMFGSILSCKVACEADGTGKGYGFIHFETESAAQNAIEKVNGMLLEDKQVYVGKFIPRAIRMNAMGESPNCFKNVYVKNFDDTLDDDKLKALFSKFGTILSAKVMVDSNGKPLGFGFVAFETSESAGNAVAELDNSEVPDNPEKYLTVCRAQKRSERQAELKRLFEQQKARMQGGNLYVKNLDYAVTNELLRETFETFGVITSAKVMCDKNNCSKGFGFVCFEKLEDATKAAVGMNGKMLANKPLYVAFAQRKEDRKAQLAYQQMRRLAAMRMQSQPGMTAATAAGAIVYPTVGNYFVQNPPAGTVSIQDQRAAAQFMQAPANLVGAANAQAQAQQMRVPNWTSAVNGGGFSQIQLQNGYAMYGGGGQPGQFQNQIARGPAGYQRGGGRQMNRQQYNQGQQGGQQQVYMRNYSNNFPKMAKTGMNFPPPRMAQNGQQYQTSQQHFNRVVGSVPQEPEMIPAHYVQQAQDEPQQVQKEPLTAEMLAKAQPQEQKTILGERLYPLILNVSKEGTDVGKVTGMILEMDNSELLMMLENGDALVTKVKEAENVLNAAAIGTEV